MFVLAYSDSGDDNKITTDSHRRYFLPRVKIENYNTEIDIRNFHDQQIDDSVKQYDEVGKVSTGQGDDNTTGCLLDLVILKKVTN